MTFTQGVFVMAVVTLMDRLMADRDFVAAKELTAEAMRTGSYEDYVAARDMRDAEMRRVSREVFDACKKASR